MAPTALPNKANCPSSNTRGKTELVYASVEYEKDKIKTPKGNYQCPKENITAEA